MAAPARLTELLDLVVSQKASDLHIFSGSAPVIRLSGELIPVSNRPPFTPTETESILKAIVPPERWSKFLETRSVDLSYAHTDQARFRINGYYAQGMIALALRLIPNHAYSFDQLNLPSVLETFIQRPQGFFLVVGPVSQGKSTTLAAMINRINETRAEHIITIEDPVEYLFPLGKSLIQQREIHVDALDFHSAIEATFREDVNVIMVGEMRDYETISAAVTAAETGHLVLSTLHTNNAAQTIDRIIDMFPAEQQDQVRVQLAGSLAGVFSQRLIPRVSGGLIPAYELLINNSAVANLIREGKTHEIGAVIQTSSEDGMIDMDRMLADLVRKGEVTVEHAYAHAMDPKTFEHYV